MILGFTDTADQKGNCGLFDDGTGLTGYLCGWGKKNKIGPVLLLHNNHLQVIKTPKQESQMINASKDQCKRVPSPPWSTQRFLEQHLAAQAIKKKRAKFRLMTTKGL